MTSWRSRWLVAAVLGVVLGAVVPGSEAPAQRKKSRLSAHVNGRRFKAWKPSVIGTYATTGYSVGGGTRPRGRRLIRQVTLSCGIIDIATAVLPAPLDCYASYTESETRRTPFKQWASYGVLVTIESYTAGRTVGTFAGTIQPTATNPADPPATIADGRFSLVLVDTGV